MKLTLHKTYWEVNLGQYEKTFNEIIPDYLFPEYHDLWGWMYPSYFPVGLLAIHMRDHGYKLEIIY